MKPAWDQLMEEFENSDVALIADVDCTAAGKSLCQDNQVRGYPSIKWGDPDDLQDYQGGRDFDSLSKFAKENLHGLPKKSEIDKAIAQLRKKLKPLEDDMNHILQFRKNAAVVLLVAGVLLGLVLSCFLSCLCRKKAKVD
eukprot:gnl/MRDRNA2_/MRDRNA2_55721_c0_seq1.p1 gnl/MRDRNA2_/MRDRNA2_55721_c0~~gnl/MRDRNA2_/MRDRNA2_55721_c0_seq1.p1  ORF type:complete len:140 (+),score=26.52 gnl/MRDRNA2_/MRDRNA2_55721_c0_seq1:224-643(+)